MARKTLLVAVIGNSDIQHATIKGPARLVGKKILDDIADGRQVEYTMPLLTDVVAKLRASTQSLAITLIATDQPDEHESDTLHFAMLVARRLREMGVRRDGIEIKTCKRNPADYGETFPFVRRLLVGLRRKDPDATCAIAPTGGTPALTAALVGESIAAFGAQTRVYYVPRGSSAARQLNVATDLHAQGVRRALLTNIANHAYGAAAALAAQERAACRALIRSVDQRRLFLALLTHGKERLNANTDGAVQALRGTDLKLLSPEDRDALRLDAAPSAQERRAQTLREIIASARVMYDLHHYFDFITRVATFRDVWAEAVACDIFEVSVRQNPKAIVVADQPDAVKRVLRGITIQNPPDWRTYRDLIAALTLKERTEADDYDQTFNQLGRLTNLRNSTIHHYDGITRELIGQYWHTGDPDTILPALQDITERAGILRTSSRDPYAALQHALPLLFDE